MNDGSASSRSILVSLVCGLFLSVLILLSVLGESRRREPSAFAAAALTILEPALSAEAYVVRLAGDDHSLMERRADKPVPPASLTKVMTAAVAAEKLAVSDTGIMSAYAKNVEERTSGAEAGAEFSRDDLLRMTLIMSANDAAIALAERVGQGAGALSSPERASRFVSLMNARARIIGMAHTHFENPTGLDAPRHAASANDLATLAEYVLVRHPRLWEMTRQPEAQVTSADGRVSTIVSSNVLLAEFPALRGGKTGFTQNGKEALILLYPVRGDDILASRAPGRTAIIVLLRSDDRFGDGRKIIRWLEENF